MPDQARSSLSDSYSIDEGMNVLEKLDDVSDASYIKTLEKFKDSERKGILWKCILLERSLGLRA